MTYPFGIDFQPWFVPLADDSNVAVPSALTGQTPNIYVYRDRPDRASARLGTGALQSITAWAWDAGKRGWQYTVGAIEDPDEDGGESGRTYWVAINFYLKLGGQRQLVIQALKMERVGGHQGLVGVTVNDLRALYPAIDAYTKDDAERLEYIAGATDDVKSRFKAGGYGWAQVHKPSELARAVKYRALSKFCLTELQKGGDKFGELHEKFEALYETEFGGLEPEIDTDKDGQADTTAKVGGSLFLIR